MDPNQPNAPIMPTPPEQPQQPFPQPQPVQSAQPTAAPTLDPGVAPAPAPAPMSTPPVVGQPIAPQQFGPMQPAQPMTPQPMAPQSFNSSQSSNSSSKLKIIIPVALVFIVILGVSVFLLTKKDSGSSSNPVTNVANKIKGNSEVVSRSDGTLDLSTLIDKQASIKNQDVKAAMNQQVNLANGMSYMVTKVERNFVPASKYAAASAGKEMVKVTIVAGYRAKSGSLYISQSDFTLKTIIGAEVRGEFSIDSDLADRLKSTTLDPGKQVTGAILYEVPKDEKITAIITEENYKNLSSSEKVAIKSSVTL
jgi:hypothetical protein